MSKQVELVLLLIASSIAASANATTLQYIGPEFQFNSSTPLVGERVTAQVTFATTLTPGSVLTLADTSSFTLAAAGRVMTHETASFAKAKFYIGPDGLPSDWGFVAEQNLERGTAPEQISTVSLDSGTTFGVVMGEFYTDFIYFDDSLPNDYLSQANGQRGTANGFNSTSWSIVPEPNAIFLCFLYTLGMAFSARFYSKKVLVSHTSSSHHQ